MLFQGSNLTPFFPYKVSGVMKGATTAFFGYVGFDEVCCLAAEVQVWICCMSLVVVVLCLYIPMFDRILDEISPEL